MRVAHENLIRPFWVGALGPVINPRSDTLPMMCRSRRQLSQSIANSMTCYPLCVRATRNNSTLVPTRVSMRQPLSQSAASNNGSPFAVGIVTNPWTFALFASWEKHFTVVQWDQRGAGKTLRKSGAAVAPSITLPRIVKDGVELSDYLRKHLGKNKIIIVGHSFGSIVGLQMARAKPDLFYACVGTGQVADNSKNYLVAYQELLKKARSTSNQQAIGELTRVGLPPYKSGEGYSVQRRWANAFEGADQFLFGTIGLTLVAPGNSVQDINDSADGQMLSAEHLVPETKSIGPEELGREFLVPIFIFQGAEDFTTPIALARHFLDSIKAPRKAFVPIKAGGHFAVFMRSDEFLQELVARVRPLAIEGTDAPTSIHFKQ